MKVRHLKSKRQERNGWPVHYTVRMTRVNGRKVRGAVNAWRTFWRVGA